MGMFGASKNRPTWERKMVQGYADRGKVADMLTQGWEIESVTPVQISGFTLKQSLFLLKRHISNMP